MTYTDLLFIYNTRPQWVSSRFAQSCLLDAIFQQSITQDLKLLVPNLCSEGYCDGWCTGVSAEAFLDCFLIKQFHNWRVKEMTEERLVLSLPSSCLPPEIKLYGKCILLKDIPADTSLKVEHHDQCRLVLRAPEGLGNSPVESMQLECSNVEDVLMLDQIRMGEQLKPYSGEVVAADTVMAAQEAMEKGFEYALPYIPPAERIH